MKKSFKTPALYNFLLSLRLKYPNNENIFSDFMPKFANLDLTPNNHLQIQETFQHDIKLFTGDSIYIVWNIDSIINFIISNNVYPEPALIEDILQTTLHNDFNKCSTKIRENYSHKIDSIIIGELPFFPKSIVIDGNHRLHEAILAKKQRINIHRFELEEAIPFLQEDSRNFFLLLNTLIMRLNRPPTI